MTKTNLKSVSSPNVFVESQLQAAVLIERERCAQIVLTLAPVEPGGEVSREELAAAIRGIGTEIDAKEA